VHLRRCRRFTSIERQASKDVPLPHQSGLIPFRNDRGALRIALACTWRFMWSAVKVANGGLS
jgi:hypothetical protein